MAILQYAVQGQGTPATGTGPFYNVFNIFTNNPTSAQAAIHVSALAAFYNALKVNLYATTQTWTIGAKVVQVDLATPIFIPVTPVTVTGSNGTAYCPPQTSLVVSWKTGQATRKGRGRTYLGPLSQSVLSVAGNFGTPTITSAQAAATALIASITSSTPTDNLCVLHRPPKGSPGSSATSTPILSALVNNVPYVQRRRGA